MNLELSNLFINVDANLLRVIAIVLFIISPIFLLVLYILEIIDLLKDVGATMVSVPDTSGLPTSSLSREFFLDLKKHTNALLSAYFHNDYGYASTVFVEAILAGVDEAHISILGLGDRNGIADLIIL